MGHGEEILSNIDPLIPASPVRTSSQEHPDIGRYNETGYNHHKFGEYMKVVQQCQTAAPTTTSEAAKAESVDILRRMRVLRLTMTKLLMT